MPCTVSRSYSLGGKRNGVELVGKEGMDEIVKF
jgi:hypothetical protein